MKRKLFGTDGIRGRANHHPMTADVALRLGQALAYVVKNGELGRKQSGHRQRIVIGKDTRLSCYVFEQAVAAGICSMGVDAMMVGPLPTPGIAFVASSMRSDAGVVISASHNAFHDNGIKIFAQDGFKLPDEMELRLESLMENDALTKSVPDGADLGRAYRIDDAVGRYVVFLKTVLPTNMTLDGLRVVIDCANGAGYKVAPLVFSELGADVIRVGADPNGTNINDGVGSLYPARLSQMVKEARADVGFALDGDADRLLVCNEQGTVVDGDALLAMCALDLKKRNRLTNDTIVTTVMSNIGLDRCLNKEGIRVVRTQVGDRYVVEAMKKDQVCFGGESSGHLIFLDHATTGDGMVAAMSILAMMTREQKPLSQLQTLYEAFPQTLLNIDVPQKVPFKELAEVQTLISAIEQKHGENGRVLVRYSGTEMKARVMVEGREADEGQRDADTIAQEILTALENH